MPSKYGRTQEIITQALDADSTSATVKVQSIGSSPALIVRSAWRRHDRFTVRRFRQSKEANRDVVKDPGTTNLEADVILRRLNRFRAIHRECNHPADRNQPGEHELTSEVEQSPTCEDQCQSRDGKRENTQHELHGHSLTERGPSCQNTSP